MSAFKNRVVSIYNHKTSMRMADAEWSAFDTICQREEKTRKQLLEVIDTCKDPRRGLTFSVRLFTLTYFRLVCENNHKHSNAPKPDLIREALKNII